MTIITLGIDLGENVCSLMGVDEDGSVVLRWHQTVLTLLPPGCRAARRSNRGAHGEADVA
jgi:hypothetical protein